MEKIDDLTIIKYETAHQPAFEQLNRAWIESLFTMEPLDFKTLRKPEEYYKTILCAILKDKVVGVVALKKIDNSFYELTKLAVANEFRGRRIGWKLCEQAIAAAKELNAQKVILYSNRKLIPAISMYQKLGFTEVPLEESIYRRCDIKMEIDLF